MTATPEDCGCGKPSPGPHGNQKPRPGQASRSLVASAGAAGSGITHVSPTGKRTPVPDMLAGRAAVIRHGGKIDFS